AKPSDLSIELNNASGSLTLRWKADNPKGTQGTSYIIRRKLPGQPEFAFIGVTGSKKFIDSTFIAGPDSVQYTVQGQRADSAGPESDPFVINFGKTASGQTVATLAGEQPMRIAA
ncbi:MAG: fibronectin type III domain-containing protein, partial [Phycisphaerales bacterium]